MIVTLSKQVLGLKNSPPPKELKVKIALHLCNCKELMGLGSNLNITKLYRNEVLGVCLLEKFKFAIGERRWRHDWVYLSGIALVRV